MKAAFGENPGLTGFIDEVTNVVLTSEEFKKKLEQVDAANVVNREYEQYVKILRTNTSSRPRKLSISS